MRLQNGLVILLTAMLINLSLSAQSVNDKVTKDNLNSAFLSSLILERINEIRSYKKAPDLRANKICQSVAVDHVDYMARNNKITKEQEADGFVTTIDRLKSFGGGKKVKGDETIAEISLEGPVTYMDLSDEITSKWITEKESTKIIENGNMEVSGIAFAINPESNMLYVSHVFGDKNLGENLVLPKKPKSAAEIAAEEEEKKQVEEKKKVEDKKVAEAAIAAKEAATVKEALPVVDSEEAEPEPAVNEAEELPVETIDEKTAENATPAQPVKEELVPESEVKAAMQPAATAPANNATASVSSTESSAGVDENIGAEEELPACISANKYGKLLEIAKFGVFYRDSSVLLRQDNLALLEEVVTKDMDGLSLVINQNHSFEDGPTPFDYSLLRDQKYYKPDIFASKEADFNLKELTSSPKSKRFAYKLSYWRIGLHCIDVDVTLRDDSFDVVAFQDSVNKELGISQDLAGSALELVWNGDFGIDTTNKRIKNVTIQIPFRKGKANYKAKDLIEMMDTLVERGFKINAAHVTAYSSVEGDYELNAKLARKRGKNVVEALRELNGGALFYGKLVTNDSWDNFYKTVGESPHPEFKDMSKDEIKAQLRPGMASTKDMEAFLSAQRYAEIQLSLEYLSQEAQDEKQAEFREIRNIYYDFGKFYVRKEAGRSLDVFSRLLKQQPEFNLIELGAHTDSRGSYAFNEKLSKRRAQSVVDYLISKGIDRSRLVPKGYGESELLNHCKDGVECSEAEHQRNRRTTFRILNEGQEIKSVEPDDISVDYAPSFRPTDGLIDLENELAAELAKKNGVGASRVYKKMIKRVMLGQMPADILNVSAEIPADVNHLDFKLHILLAKVVLLQESEGIMEAFDQIIQIDPTAPFVVYNAMAYKLLKDQGFVAALKADASKKVQVVGILNSIRESKFPTDKLDRLISFVNSL